jgi:putative sterol carrier protein
MSVYHYCTKEWLEESFRLYQTNDKLKGMLTKVTNKMTFRVMADPAWGLDQDVLFAGFFESGEMERLSFITLKEAQKESDFILAATPEEWINVLKKKTKFIARFMMSQIKLDQGDKVDVLKLAPYARELIGSLTQVEIQYANEMNAEELESYRKEVTDSYSDYA